MVVEIDVEAHFGTCAKAVVNTATEIGGVCQGLGGVGAAGGTVNVDIVPIGPGFAVLIRVRNFLIFLPLIGDPREVVAKGGHGKSGSVFGNDIVSALIGLGGVEMVVKRDREVHIDFAAEAVLHTAAEIGGVCQRLGSVGAAGGAVNVGIVPIGPGFAVLIRVRDFLVFLPLVGDQAQVAGRRNHFQRGGFHGRDLDVLLQSHGGKLFRSGENDRERTRNVIAAIFCREIIGFAGFQRAGDREIVVLAAVVVVLDLVPRGVIEIAVGVKASRQRGELEDVRLAGCEREAGVAARLRDLHPGLLVECERGDREALGACHPGDAAAVVLTHIYVPTRVTCRIIGRGGHEREAVLTEFRRTLPEMNLLQAFAGIKCESADPRHAERNGVSAGSARGEADQSFSLVGEQDAVDALISGVFLGDVDLLQAAAVLEHIVAHVTQAAADRHARQVIAGMENAPAEVGDAVRDGHARQAGAAHEGAAADAPHAVRERNICHFVAVVERVIADIGNVRVEDDALDTVPVFVPGAVRLTEIPHLPGAGDGQDILIAQLPGQVVAAFTGGDDGRLLRALRHPGDRAAVVLHHVLGPARVVRRVIGRGGNGVEAILADLRSRTFKTDLTQVHTAEKRINTNCRNARRDRYSRKTAALRKGPLINVREAFGNRHACQIAAVTEYRRSHSRHVGRNRHAAYGALCKSAGNNARHAVRNRIVSFSSARKIINIKFFAGFFE